MTLHEAIEKLLLQKGKPMTARDISDELNKKEWYIKKDNTPIKSSQINARVNKYPQLFEINRSISPHRITLNKK